MTEPQPARRCSTPPRSAGRRFGPAPTAQMRPKSFQSSLVLGLAGEWHYSPGIWLLGDASNGSVTIGLIYESLPRAELAKVLYESEQSEWYREFLDQLSESERKEEVNRTLDCLKRDTWQARWEGESRGILPSLRRTARLTATGSAFQESCWLDLPLWIPFVLCVAYPTVVLVRSPYLFRKRYRRKHGLCIRCAYNLTGNTSGICPECGTRIDR